MGRGDDDYQSSPAAVGCSPYRALLDVASERLGAMAFVLRGRSDDVVMKENGQLEPGDVIDIGGVPCRVVDRGPLMIFRKDEKGVERQVDGGRFVHVERVE